ncbi:unnamed protein product [Ilex paraguariensis]|uniref:Uncharacterized protein n=1 Tax=Ilex paraguariensis TaxID=185542 RepID=A0ABC8R8C3_9AQUA
MFGLFGCSRFFLSPVQKKRRSNVVPRTQGNKSFQGDSPNWVLIAGGALLSTFSVSLGYKLKQLLDTKQPDHTSNDLKGLGVENMSADRSQGTTVRIQMCTVLPKMRVAASIAFQVVEEKMGKK